MSNRPGEPADDPMDSTDAVDTTLTFQNDCMFAPGMRIGSYCLLQMVGHGGMGEVWLAEQQAPIRRRVAIKMIKAGMDTHDVVARFTAERQALAMMDHPGIARVFEAGATPTGRPFFAMEYVPGVPITTYCDKHTLTTRERLELFLKVCDAVQHAHHKAIIHRDLKPSNILVSEIDGKPTPKVIDFGVAKAVANTLGPHTMVTRVGCVLGTIEYMSPEQADAAQEDVDTRADIYSLGVVLYELLAGALPVECSGLAFTQVLRKLRDEDAQPPVRACGPPTPRQRSRSDDGLTLRRLPGNSRATSTPSRSKRSKKTAAADTPRQRNSPATSGDFCATSRSRPTGQLLRTGSANTWRVIASVSLPRVSSW